MGWVGSSPPHRLNIVHPSWSYLRLIVEIQRKGPTRMRQRSTSGADGNATCGLLFHFHPLQRLKNVAYLRTTAYDMRTPYQPHAFTVLLSKVHPTRSLLSLCTHICPSPFGRCKSDHVKFTGSTKLTSIMIRVVILCFDSCACPTSTGISQLFRCKKLPTL
jgi:hypothetical protein